MNIKPDSFSNLPVDPNSLSSQERKKLESTRESWGKEVSPQKSETKSSVFSLASSSKMAETEPNLETIESNLKTKIERTQGRIENLEAKIPELEGKQLEMAENRLKKLEKREGSLEYDLQLVEQMKNLEELTPVELDNLNARLQSEIEECGKDIKIVDVNISQLEEIKSQYEKWGIPPDDPLMKRLDRVIDAYELKKTKLEEKINILEVGIEKVNAEIESG